MTTVGKNSYDTPWYPGHIKPVRTGLYKRKYQNKLYWCHYTIDGNWGIMCSSPRLAYMLRYYPCEQPMGQFLPWCGCRVDPSLLMI